MFRTRFKKEIVAEFLPPARPRKKQRVILLCDGMPSIPRKQPLAEFLAQKGYWVFYPRWRGAWESDGQFLERPPQEDLSDIMDELPKGVLEAAFGRKFKLSPDEIFVIRRQLRWRRGNSFVARPEGQKGLCQLPGC